MGIFEKFEGNVLGVNKREDGMRDLILLNENNGDELSVPEWCITDFVYLPEELLDDEQHVKIGSTLKLWEMEDGKIFPDRKFYQLKERKDADRPTNLKHMSPDSLFEDAVLYAPTSLDELLKKFAERNEVTPFPSGDIMKVMALGNKDDKSELVDFLSDLLGISCLKKLSCQESRTHEYKSSFLHCAKPIRNERAAQYQQIFQVMTSFGNSHLEGKIYVGVDNNGEVVGIEKELESGTNFDNKADFLKDFKNTLSQCVNNYAFTSSISFRWYKTQDMKLFCEIIVPKWEGEILFLNGDEIYVRDEAGKRQLKNKDIVDFIVNKYGQVA